MQRARFTLLQARNPDDPVRAEERLCFASRLDVTVDQIRTVDIFTETLDERVLDGAVALFVGGSGDYSVLDPLPQITRFIEFLAEVADQGFPTFASCFGFQAMAVGLGGEVIHDAPNAEVGSHLLSLTPEAAQDPLFHALPTPFVAQLGHKDRASRLPDCAVPLASSDRCPYQAFRVAGRPVYATQFHPEMSWIENRRRFERYMRQYGSLFGAAEAQRILDSHQPSPESNALLSRFVEEFCQGEGR